MKFNTTKDINISNKISDQIIGQDPALDLIKKAAKQRRHVLLIGDPGTGKSMLGQALAELLPKEKLVDIISYNNTSDENKPIIKTVPKGQGKDIIFKESLRSKASSKNQYILFIILAAFSMLTPWWVRKEYGDIMAAASLIGSMVFVGALLIFINLNRRMKSYLTSKILIDNSETETAPFQDATGAHAGALLGDVLHDPLQSFSPGLNISVIQPTKNGLCQIQNQKLQTTLNQLFQEYNQDIIRKDSYEALFLPKNTLQILGYKDNLPLPIDVLSINRYQSNKPYLYKITTESGKELIVTPEHKVAIDKKGKKHWIKSSKLKKGHKVFTNN